MDALKTKDELSYVCHKLFCAKHLFGDADDMRCDIQSWNKINFGAHELLEQAINDIEGIKSSLE